MSLTTPLPLRDLLGERLDVNTNAVDSVQPKAVKFDEGKTQWDLMPFEAVEQINKVLEFGAKKYAKHNWRLNGGLGTVRVLNSCLRHLFAYMRGEKVDPESGLSHLAHAGCNILFALYYDMNKTDTK